MSEDSGTKSSFRLSRIIRMVAFGILAVMLLLAVIAQFTVPPTAQDSIDATVEAGVNQRLTEVMVQTGTPNPTALRATIDASADATLTQIVVTAATPTPILQAPPPPEGVPGILIGIWNFVMGILNWFWGIITGLWNFAGRGGIVVQVLCCIVPSLAIIIGIVNDK
jgi:hypothetical protein